MDPATLADLIKGADPDTSAALTDGRGHTTERDLPFAAKAVQVVINEPWGERGAWFGVTAERAVLLSGDPDAFVGLAQSVSARIDDADTALRYAVDLLDTTRSFDQPEYRVESISDIQMSPPLIDDDRRAAEEFRVKYTDQIGPPSVQPGAHGGFDVTTYRVRKAKVEKVTVTVGTDGAAAVSAEALEPTPPLPMSL